MRLTEEDISELACEPGQKDRLVFDDALPGLAVRITARGRKFFLAQYTIRGQRRRVPIGQWGSVTLKAARLAARGILGDVAKGQDVAHLRATARKAEVAEKAANKLTLAALLEQWDGLVLAQQRENYRYEALRAIKAAFPDHLERRADALTRESALAALDGLAKAGKAAMAGRTLAYARACYTWATKRDLVPSNPFLSLPIGSGTVSRDRVLTTAEVGLVWAAAGRMPYPFGPMLRLLLLTAQRREEVAGMGWSELSSDMAVWTIPKHRAKNGRAHIVHLVPAARAILAGLPRFKNSDLVFTTSGRTPVSGFSRAKERLDTLIEELRREVAARAGQPEPEVAMLAWRVHDFRRTAVTWMAGNGVAPHVADRILNHVRGTISGVAAVYQRAEFLAERKAALERWAQLVLGCFVASGRH